MGKDVNMPYSKKEKAKVNKWVMKACKQSGLNIGYVNVGAKEEITVEDMVPPLTSLRVAHCPTCGQPCNTRNDAEKYFKKKDDDDNEGVNRRTIGH